MVKIYEMAHLVLAWSCFSMAAPAVATEHSRVHGEERHRDPEVRSWRLGSFRVFTEEEPFRIALHDDERPLLVERARVDGAAMEFRTSSGWHSVTRLKSARREVGASSLEPALLLEVEAPGGVAARLSLRWLAAPRALELRWEFSGEGVLALRDDFVTDATETFHGVADGTPLMVSDGEPAAEVSRPRERWLLSSRGFALRGRSPPGASLEAFFPDPDSLRIESSGASLELVLIAGEPRQTLRWMRSLSSPAESTASPASSSPEAAHEGDADVKASADVAGSTPSSAADSARARSGLWLRFDRLPESAGRDRLLEELRRCGLPMPALLVGERDGDGALFEAWAGSTGLPDSRPVRSSTLFLPAGDRWRELRDVVRSRLDRSLTGSPEWVTVSRRVVERVAARSPDPATAPGSEGPLPRPLDPEFAARLLAVASAQPLLCVDWDGDELRFEADDHAIRAVRRRFLIQGALARLANALSADGTEGRLPLWRHLFVEFPDDPVAWEPRDQWLYGPEVMVAPVLSAGAAQRVAYFPLGTWVEVGREDGAQVVSGPKRALIDVPIGELGLFERRDAWWGVRQYLAEPSESDE